jgi:hypothetical protein
MDKSLQLYLFHIICQEIYFVKKSTEIQISQLLTNKLAYFPIRQLCS